MLATENRADVADWAGTSPKEIDRHYKRPIIDETGDHHELIEANMPVTKKLVRAWFFTYPADAEDLPRIKEKSPADNGRLGGMVRSAAKSAANRRKLDAIRAK